MINNFYEEKNYQLLMDQLIARLKAKKSERVYNVEKAYELARELHKTQFRQSGEPYILHPVIVATILEKLDFDTDVISAGLLHDVVEDCNYSVKEIEEEFNKSIAEIVDAVTAITKNEYEQELDAIFDNSNFLKSSMESKTYQKLMKIGKKNRFAFYIKFADRLHNLKTIGIMKEYKQLEKVKETEKWILPLCDILKSGFFYNTIKNECFKIINEKKMTTFQYNYDLLQKNNAKKHHKLQELLYNALNAYIARNQINNSLYKIIFSPVLEEQVYLSIANNLEIKGIQNIKSNHLLKVPTCDLFLIFNNDSTDQKFNELVFALMEDKKVRSELGIIGFHYDSKFKKHYFIITDNYRNKYKVAAMSVSDYLIYQNGSTDGSDIDLIDEESSSEIVTEYIRVRTRSNEIIEIPAGSTALDFAFKIHNDIGFSFKYATINNSPIKHAHYTKLKDNDKISIVTERDEVSGKLIETAQIRWLAYVKTERAKKALIRYFEKKFSTN